MNFQFQIRHTVLNLVLVCLGLLTFASSTQAQFAQTHRHLIICIDGVGYTIIEKMRAEGRFKLFHQPAQMIAPFPTLTDVSLSEILRPTGAGEPAGYEDSYYDVASNRMRGGIADRFRQDRFIAGTYRDLFDYHPSALKSGLMGYAAPPLSTYLAAVTDLARLRQKFRASSEPVFFGYTGATDTLAHLGGERLLRSFLARLDDTLTEIVRESEGNTEVTIFSDHGNLFMDYKRAPLKDALKRAGFKRANKLKDERSVVLPQFGLVGSAVLWTKKGNEQRLADVLAQVRGVDFAAYEQDGVVHVVNRTGQAVIERRGGRFSYRALTGDPLELREAVRALTAQGKIDADGFSADMDWFAATCAGARPDVVRRVYASATQLVRNRASVVVSLNDGYYTGSVLLDIVAFMQATHGNIGRGQSLGFVMNSTHDLPAYLRAGDVWPALGSPVIKKATERNLTKAQ